MGEHDYVLKWIQFRGIAPYQEIWCRACNQRLIPLPKVKADWNVQHFTSEDHQANVSLVKLAGESR